MRGAWLQVWNLVIIVIDAFFTALWLPVVAAFEYKIEIWDPAGIAIFLVGIILFMDVFIRFHAPIRLTSGYLSLLLNKPGAIAHFYTRRGSFAIDVVSAAPLIVLPFVPSSSRFVLFVVFLRLARIQRVRWVINMLFYILMMSTRGASALARP